MKKSTRYTAHFASVRGSMLSSFVFCLFSACSMMDESVDSSASGIKPLVEQSASVSTSAIQASMTFAAARSSASMAQPGTEPVVSSSTSLTTVDSSVLDGSEITLAAAPVAPRIVSTSASTLNSIKVSAPNAATSRLLPVQLGRVFKQGEVRNSPVLTSAGVAIPTQASVKTRWTDGSVKHALIAGVLDLNATSRELRFADSAEVLAAPVVMNTTRLRSLIGGTDLQVALVSPSGARSSIKLSDLINASAIEQVWIDGTVMSSVVLADHSERRAFDFGFDANKSIRPIFHVTVWPGLGLVKVRVILENSNPTVLQDVTYAVEITNTSGALLFRQDNVKHTVGSRWTKEFSNQALPNVKIDHNLAYLKESGALSNYDTTLQIKSSAVNEWNLRWANAPKNLYDAGLWTKYMPTTGGRADIGLMPVWTLLWLYTGDVGLQNQTIANAELAMAWPMNFRESKSTVQFDRKTNSPGLGRVVTPEGRPSLFLQASNVFIRFAYTSVADRLNLVGPYSEDGNGWVPDVSHQPEAFAIPYMLTGEYWMLEQLYFWTSWNIFSGAPGAAARYDSRGPSLTSAGISEQTRGEAWSLRTRALAAYLAPDASAEKTYFTRITNEAIVMWEGIRSIPSPNSGSADYRWGQVTGSQKYLSYSSNAALPLNHWDQGSDRGAQNGGFDLTKVKATVAPWQQHFMALSLGRAQELGFDTTRLLKWSAGYIDSMMDETTESRWIAGMYSVAMVDARTNNYFPTWKASLEAMGPLGLVAKSDFERNVIHIDSGYSQFASAASAVLKPFYRSSTTDFFYRDQVRLRSDYTSNPKWAILPRE